MGAQKNMRTALIFALSVAYASATYVGGYTLINGPEHFDRLQSLADNAETIPVNRVWLAFFRPDMVYEKGTNSLAGTGFEVGHGSDKGFAKTKAAIAKLQAGGVEVFLSLGGWDYNCFPYAYAQYSIAGYGSTSPQYWHIEKYGNGDVSHCTPDNQYCYVCEPKSAGEGAKDYLIFPEPSNSTTWQQAQKFVEASAQVTPEWHPQIIPGQMYTDQQTGRTEPVPGSDAFMSSKSSDPYADFVQLAADLGVDGVDLDYEEFWHADAFKSVASGGSQTQGPFNLHQTVYKYTAIAKDLMLNINSKAPHLKLSTAAGAVSAWSSKWWGGNLKGLLSEMQRAYPEVVRFMTEGVNAGGINVMTYDLSNDQKHHECPDDAHCSLSAQVDFYMDTYAQAGIPAAVGYEVGAPAYPSSETEGVAHQLPLTPSELASIVSNTQSKHKSVGGFLWALHKPAAGQASATAVAQAICKEVLGAGAKRCSGNIPSASSEQVWGVHRH